MNTIEDMMDEPPPLVDHDDDDENDDDIEEEEINFNEEPCLDLFSSQVFPTTQECLDHCKKVHGFDIKILKEKHDLDCFSFIQMINYIRQNKPSSEFVMSLENGKLWRKDEFMKPVIANDSLLMFDIEEVADENCSELDSIQSLRKELEEMRAKAEMLEKAFFSDVENMRQTTKNLINADDSTRNNHVKDVASSIKAEEDGGYAGSYAHFSIHHEMLSDTKRTEAYRDAIYNNAEQVEGKSVLDLGCGTGILSMFCAKAGAKDVTGVDMSDILHHTRDIVRENNFEEKIKLIKGRLEDVKDLEGKKFDILVSEWMGYFLLYEGMLDSVISARDKYLKPGGLILPNDCFMYLFAISDEEHYAKNIGFWQNVYGFKMTCMKEPVLTEGSVEVVNDKHIVSPLVQILHLDLTTCKIEDFASFSTDFELEASKSCDITAIGGSFDTIFAQVKHPVNLSTSPFCQPTHWKQTVFYLEKKISVTKGQRLKGHICLSRPPKDARGLLVTLVIDGKKRVYDMA